MDLREAPQHSNPEAGGPDIWGVTGAHVGPVGAALALPNRPWFDGPPTSTRMARRRSRRNPPAPFAILAALLALWLSGSLTWVSPLPPLPPWAGPLAWLSGAVAVVIGGVALHRAWARRRLLDQHRTLASLYTLDWAAFERLVGEAYRRQGWGVTETGQGGADGGIDLVLRKAGRTKLVQVKHWKGRVGAPVVREMLGLLHHHRADALAIVALGGFTKEALAFAAGKPLELLDGAALVALIGGTEASRPLPKAAGLDPATPDPAVGPSRASGATGTPPCPLCAGTMVARRRRSDGQAFWGCLGYPACGGTRPRK